MLAERRGTLASGAKRKARYSIEIRSEPLLVDLDEMNLGNGPAEAIASLIRDQINGISERASDATIAIRKKAAKAFAEGKGLARYAGGRLGPMAPNTSDKLFVDSGRLARGIHVRPNMTDKTYSVNVAANRLNPGLFGAGYEAMVNKLVSRVPALDPKKLMGMPTVEKAISQAVSDMVAKAEANSEAAILRKLGQLRAAKKRALQAVLGVARGALGL